MVVEAPATSIEVIAQRATELDVKPGQRGLRALHEVLVGPAAAATMSPFLVLLRFSLDKEGGGGLIAVCGYHRKLKQLWN